MIDLKTVFPRASQSFLGANQQNDVQPIMDAPRPKSEVRRGRMNKTEAEYAMILEAMKRKGEILRYEFEGITLRFAGVKYTPDFLVLIKTDFYISDFGLDGVNVPQLKLIEVKGPFIKGNRERAIERFRHAKTYWPEFSFELHQRTKDGWRQLL